MASSLLGVYVLIGILVVGIAIIVILFSVQAPPFNKPYKFLDPRTWEPVESNQVWLQPEFDYGPYTRSEPTIEITEMYNGLITSLGGTPVVY